MPNRSEILCRAWQYHCRVLCKFRNGLTSEIDVLEEREFVWSLFKMSFGEISYICNSARYQVNYCLQEYLYVKSIPGLQTLWWLMADLFCGCIRRYSCFHKNIIRHTAHTTVIWPNPFMIYQITRVRLEILVEAICMNMHHRSHMVVSHDREEDGRFHIIISCEVRTYITLIIFRFKSRILPLEAENQILTAKIRLKEKCHWCIE